MEVLSDVRLRCVKLLENTLLKKMIFSSFGISIVVFLVQLISSRYLPISVFVDVSLVVYKVALLASVSNLANDFYVMRVNNKNKETAVQINFLSIISGLLILLVVLSGMDLSNVEKVGCVAIVLASSIMALYSSKLRLVGEAVVSSFTERFIPVCLTLVFIFFLFGEYFDLDFYKDNILGAFLIIVFFVTSFLYFFVRKAINTTIKFKVDRSFFKHQILMYISILFFISFTYLDKVVAESYLSVYQLAYYIVIFQIFSIFKIFGQVLYKYLFVHYRGGRTVVNVFTLKSFIQVLLVGVVAVSIFYPLLIIFYEGKFEIYLSDVVLIVVASLIFVAYQVLAAKITSSMGERAMILMIISNILSMAIVMPIFYVGLTENEPFWLLMAFVSFWLFKVASGLMITRIKGVDVC